MSQLLVELPVYANFRNRIRHPSPDHKSFDDEKDKKFKKKNKKDKNSYGGDQPDESWQADAQKVSFVLLYFWSGSLKVTRFFLTAKLTKCKSQFSKLADYKFAV